MAATSSTAVIRAMKVSAPVAGLSRFRSQTDPVSLTYRFASALVSAKWTTLATLLDDGLGEWLALDGHERTVLFRTNEWRFDLLHKPSLDQCPMESLSRRILFRPL